MDATTLQLIWYVLLGILLAGYAILDGFDLGVGILHLFARDDNERRVMMNSIGPLWDGNEVWLVVFGGALFAAFPEAYAAAFSGFYLGFLFVLACLIFRGVSMEFRSKHHAQVWRQFWDVAFCLSSLLATFLFGILVGNCIQGVPLGPDREFTHALALAELLNPYAVLVGLFAVYTFALHGAIYLYLKTEGALQERVRSWMWTAYFLFLAHYLLVTLCTWSSVERSLDRYLAWPVLWLLPILNALAIANIPRCIRHGWPLMAFVSSACSIAAFTGLFGVTLFPHLLVSNLDPKYSLTVANAASTEPTLWLMLLVAMLGLPFVLSYTIVIYWVFRGKVRIDKASY